MSLNIKELADYEQLAIKIYKNGGDLVINDISNGKLSIESFNSCIQNYVDLMILITDYEAVMGTSFKDLTINMFDTRDPMETLTRVIQVYGNLMKQIFIKNSDVITNQVVKGYIPDIRSKFPIYSEFYTTTGFFRLDLSKSEAVNNINVHFNVPIHGVHDPIHNLLILSKCVVYAVDESNIYLIREEELVIHEHIVSDFNMDETCNLFEKNYRNLQDIYNVLISSPMTGLDKYKQIIEIISVNLGRLINRLGCVDRISIDITPELSSVNFIHKFLEALGVPQGVSAARRQRPMSAARRQELPSSPLSYQQYQQDQEEEEEEEHQRSISVFASHPTARTRDDLTKDLCLKDGVKYVIGESIIKDIEVQNSSTTRSMKFTYKGMVISPLSIDVIGSGSYGEVLKVEFLDNGNVKHFAVKLDKDKSRIDEHEFLEKYSDAYECGKLLNMRTSNFAVLMDIASGDLTYFQDKIIYFDQAIEIIKIVRDILVCLNSKNYYYMDIKPDNILFKCTYDDKVEIMLGDLGSIVPNGGYYVATFPAPGNKGLSIRSTPKHLKQYQTYCLLIVLFLLTTRIGPFFFFSFSDLESLIRAASLTHGRSNRHVKALEVCYKTNSFDHLLPIDEYIF